MIRLARTAHALAAGAALLLAACAGLAVAGEFAIAPIRLELKPGVMNDTITVTNEAPTRLRVAMKLLEWTQDAKGEDVFRDSTDLIYFPRAMDVQPNARRLVRVGANAPTGEVEKAYRLFIEEQPEASAEPGRSQVAIYFRFGVPIFLPPANGKPQPEVLPLTLDHGKAVVTVRNTGTQHFRLHKAVFSDLQGFTREVQGWYSLAGSTRNYEAVIPPDVCRKAKVLRVQLEGEGLQFERTVNVDAARCD